MSFGKDAVAFIFEMQSEIIIYLSRYWLDHTLKPNVRAQVWYNGRQPYGLRGYMNDRVNRMIGHAIVRQIREEIGTCK